MCSRMILGKYSTPCRIFTNCWTIGSISMYRCTCSAMYITYTINIAVITRLYCRICYPNSSITLSFNFYRRPSNTSIRGSFASPISYISSFIPLNLIIHIHQYHSTSHDRLLHHTMLYQNQR